MRHYDCSVRVSPEAHDQPYKDPYLFGLLVSGRSADYVDWVMTVQLEYFV